jgi:hypothetical protein
MRTPAAPTLGHRVAALYDANRIAPIEKGIAFFTMPFD